MHLPPGSPVYGHIECCCRHLLREWVAGFLRGRWRNWELVDKAMELEGWKLLLLVRLSPIVPYNLLNIAMATTPIHFWQFAFVSAIGMCALTQPESFVRPNGFRKHPQCTSKAPA